MELWIIFATAVIAIGLGYFLHIRRVPRLEWPPVLQTPYRHISHRGASGLAPENTMEAFRIAVEDYHTDAIEIDVHVSKDGEVVIIHDDSVERTTNSTGLIRNMRLSEIQELDAGYHFPEDSADHPYRGKGLQIPTLREAFEQFPRTKFNIDIKQVHPPAEQAVIDVIRECGAVDRVFLGSEKKRTLKRIKAITSDIATFNCHRAVRRFLLYHWLHLHVLYRPTDYAMQVLPETEWLKVVTPDTVKFAHSKGMVMHVWTINDEDEMRWLLRLGVDGIMSDYPDRLRHVLDEMQD